MKKISILLLATLLLASCGVSKSVAVQQRRPRHNGEVKVCNDVKEVPDKAVFLGSVSIGDTSFTFNCGYDVILEKCLNEARKLGGNYFLITRHYDPYLLNNCHSIKGNVYFVEKEQNE